MVLVDAGKTVEFESTAAVGKRVGVVAAVLALFELAVLEPLGHVVVAFLSVAVARELHTVGMRLVAVARAA
jgi:hypothetical protein